MSPRWQVVTRAIVSAHYSILVRAQSSHLIKNRTEVVVTNEVRLEQTDKNMRRRRPSKADSVSQVIYSQAKEEFEIFKDAFLVSIS